MKPPRASFRRAAGLTIVELIWTGAIVALLVLVGFSLAKAMKIQAGIAISTSQLHSLVSANGAYAMDHDGVFCPAMSRDNLTRWHGGRDPVSDIFEPERGYLAPYLSRRLITCPLLAADKDLLDDGGFEKGAGGYGYNAQYIGGRPGEPFRGAETNELDSLGNVVMFATTAFAVPGGIQEYPFTEPYYWMDKAGRIGGDLQPSTHFRANGKALVAWGDGTVTRESPADDDGPNFYGNSNKKHNIGWFGPREQNGYWNPNSPICTRRRR